jgi:hypothetical protein
MVVVAAYFIPEYYMLNDSNLSFDAIIDGLGEWKIRD